jgi:hypothetical protein
MELSMFQFSEEPEKKILNIWRPMPLFFIYYFTDWY